ncbi:hypothetical protein Tco_1342153 [Tanacetum coccineum]
MACDVSWMSSLSKLNDENVLLKTQVDYVVQERENIKLEYQKLFNSIKATRAQHQHEVNELIESISQKTYAYDSDAPQIVTSSEEPITQESLTPVLEIHSDEQIQKDVAELDGNTIMHSFELLEFKEADSSSNYQDPSNMHEFHQQHRYTNKWTKNHQIELVIGDRSKPVQTRNRL